jgi:molybdate transport system substrate-binding protein
MRVSAVIAATVIGLASLLGQGGAVSAAEINILSSNGLKEVLQDLAPEFSRTTSHKLSMVFDSSSAIERRIEGGESFDVAIATPPMIADLVKQGKIAAGTSADIARTGLGVAIRAGAAQTTLEQVITTSRLLISMEDWHG